MKILHRSPCNLTFGVIKSKGLPQGLSPATLFVPSCLSNALSHIHALSLTLPLTGYWHVLGHLAGRQMEPSYSPAPAWPTLPDSSLSSANHSQDQAQLRKTTGFMAYHNCQILNITSDETEGLPATARFCKTQEGFCQW